MTIVRSFSYFFLSMIHIIVCGSQTRILDEMFFKERAGGVVTFSLSSHAWKIVKINFELILASLRKVNATKKKKEKSQQHGILCVVSHLRINPS